MFSRIYSKNLYNKIYKQTNRTKLFALHFVYRWYADLLIHLELLFVTMLTGPRVNAGVITPLHGLLINLQRRKIYTLLYNNIQHTVLTEVGTNSIIAL
jgi:hypothetical protein